MFISQYSKLTELGLRVAPATRWLMTSALLITILGLWYMAAFSTLSTRAAVECAQLESLKQEQTVLSSLQQTHEQVSRAFMDAQTAWNLEAKQLAAQATHEQLFRLLQLFTKHDITMQSYHPHAAVDRGWYTAMSAQVHVTCTFDGLLGFLESVSKNEIHLSCEQLRIERRDNQLYVVMTVSYKIPKELGNAKTD